MIFCTNYVKYDVQPHGPDGGKALGQMVFCKFYDRRDEQNWEGERGLLISFFKDGK